MGSLVDQPFQDSVEIGFLFGADSITADLSVGDRLHVQSFDQLVHGKFVRQVGLVAQDKQRNPIKNWLFEQCVELLLCYRDGSFICGVHDVPMDPCQLC